jgi:site-specific DNA recombinase
MGQDGTGRVCDSHPVRVEVLDELVWQNVQQLIQDPQLVLQEYTQRVGAKPKQRLSLEQLLSKKQQEIRQQEGQKQRLLDLYQAGSISLEDIQTRLEQIRGRIQQIQQEWKLLQHEKEQQLRQLQLIEQFETFQHKLTTNLSNLEFEQKKALVRLLVKEVIVDATTEEIILRHTLPLDNNTPSDHSGNSGTSEGETQHDDHNDTWFEISEKIEKKRKFKEAFQESFPLYKGSGFTVIGEYLPACR